MTHWLLDLDVDGNVYRLSDVDLDVVAVDGTVLHYAAGVEVAPVTESLSLLSPSATQPEAQLVLYLPEVSAFGFLRARGELARWTEGTTYETRRRVVTGALQTPQIDHPQAGVAATLAQDAWTDPEMITGASLVVSTDTWAHTSTLLDGALGLAYPLVIGHPGRTSSGGVSGQAALRVDQRLAPTIGADFTNVSLLLAGHHVSATRVTLCTDTDPSGIIAHVANVYDAAGQPVAVCPWFWSSDAVPLSLDYDGAATYAFTGGVGEVGIGSSSIDPSYNQDDTQPTVYASWQDTIDATSGGLSVDGVLLREAGGVLDYILALSGALVDHARMAEAKRALAPFLIDAVIAERVSPWDWVTQALLPILPCSLAGGADGVFIVPLLLDLDESAAEARLDTRRPDVVRSSPLGWDTSQLVRSVTVRYAYSVRKSTYTASVVYGSQAAATADASGVTRAHPTLTTAAAWGLSGEDLVIETGVVYEDQTADLAADTLARVRGLPIGTVTFDVPESDDQFRGLERGAPVYCYDADTGIDRMGQVRDVVTAGDGSLAILVWFILNPLRDVLA